MSEQKDSKKIVNPYVYPGLRIDESERQNIFTDALQARYKITIEELLEIISKETGVSIQDILRRSRKKEIINARFIYCSILRTHFGYTLERIGETLDSRDHTSIRHALIQYKNRVTTEESFRDTVHNIYNRIGFKTK